MRRLFTLLWSLLRPSERSYKIDKSTQSDVQALEYLKLFATGDVTNIIDAVTVAVINALMRINQLPVSATRWQHGILEMICNFYLVKNANLVIAQLPLKLDKKWHMFAIIGSLEIFNVCLTKYKRNQCYLIKLATDC